MIRTDWQEMIRDEIRLQKHRYPGRKHSVGAFCTILRSELREAEESWCKGNDDLAMLEIMQIATVAIRAIEEHGVCAHMLNGRHREVVDNG
jgi:hypothetical protein